MANPAVKNQFKVPEGRYVLHSEKTAGLVPFVMRRTTRLTIAALHGGEEEGMYMIYNVGDYLHVCPFDATEKEPLCSLIFNPTAVRDGNPCCHAYFPARDGLDLVVGIANGEVALISLRAQLASPPGNTRPIIAATFNQDNLHDSTRCNVVLFVPRSNGTQFLAAHASGTILVYKKSPAITGESSGKLLSHLTSTKTTSHNPVQATSVPNCGGINDAAFSPDGSKLAVACRDGSIRLLDWPSGTCVGGYQSYYGAALCVCWSPDAVFVASGGEDDLVAVYSVADKQVVAFGEGHNSWVSKVAFDPYSCRDTRSSTSIGPAAAANQLHEKLYRLGSVGQDTTMCLWDLVEVVEDSYHGNSGCAQVGGLRRIASQLQVNIPTVSSSANLAAAQQQQQQQQQPQEQHPPSSSAVGGHSRSTSESSGVFAAVSPSTISSSVRQGSGNLLSLLKQQPSPQAAAAAAPQPVPLTLSLPRSEMTMLPPAMQHRIHMEPVSDILFTEEAIFTACCSGQIKCWLRPEVAEQLEREDLG